MNGRFRVRRISWPILAVFLWVATSVSAEPRVAGVGAIGMTVSDMDRSVAFYSETLTFEKISDVEFHKEAFDRLTGIFGTRVRIVTMRLGDERLELTEYLAPRGRPIPPDSRSDDRWFQHIAIVVRDMDAAYGRLRRLGVSQISTGPQRIPDWNEAAAGIRAFYFRDPDGHPLELIFFPPGKGDPRWQRNPDSLFLGIDHTAIAVRDTDASLAFYRDTLGLTVAGESMNYGIEQEHLNHVFGSRVRITGLRAPAGPGIEFLEYVTPRGGRPYPQDARPNDLLHWHVTLFVEDHDGMVERMERNRVTLISAFPASLEGTGLDGKRGMLIRDPDSHALLLVER
jgi:catechol 2,3-dioxygenase-like lactoylglutathione lyase family enzyme